jgi:hypothetical protein
MVVFLAGIGTVAAFTGRSAAAWTFLGLAAAMGVGLVLITIAVRRRPPSRVPPSPWSGDA